MSEPQDLISDAVDDVHEWMSGMDVETRTGDPTTHIRIEVDAAGRFVLTALRGVEILAEVKDPLLATAFRLLSKELPDF